MERFFRVSPLTPFLLFAAVGAIADLRAPTPAEVTLAETEYAKAQQDFYAALKIEPRATAQRKAELRREILEPKEKALEDYHRNSQLRQLPTPGPLRAIAAPSASPSPALSPSSSPSPSATLSPNAAELAEVTPVGPPPPPVSVIEFGKSRASPTAQPSTRYNIEEAGTGDAPVDYHSKPKRK